MRGSKKKKRTILAGFLASGIGVILLAGCTTMQREQAALQAQAKVTRAQAEQAALAHAPGGHIKDAELDQEDDKLVWWLDIVTPGAKNVTEVDVDAMTGGVISVVTEIPEP